MSSRSLAAARARRAGEQAPPISGNRPITSIGSQAAFMHQNTGQIPSPNVRVARSQGSQQQQYPRMQKQNSQKFYEQNIEQSKMQFDVDETKNKLPFSKISVSDAIGLITLRLGRVEQWIIETEHENNLRENETNKELNTNGIDNSVLTTLIGRIENLENNKLENNSGLGLNIEDIKKMNDENMNVFLEKMDECLAIKKSIDEFTKNTDNKLPQIEKMLNEIRIENAKKSEQILNFNRELTSLRDMLKSFMLTYDNYVVETNNKLSDYENALAEIENNITNPIINYEDNNNNAISMQLQNEEEINNEIEHKKQELSIGNTLINQEQEQEKDFKTMLKNELANINI